MGSRNYQYGADHIDNGLERAFRKVFANSAGSADSVGVVLHNPKAMKPWKPGRMSRECHGIGKR